MPSICHPKCLKRTKSSFNPTASTASTAIMAIIGIIATMTTITSTSPLFSSQNNKALFSLGVLARGHTSNNARISRTSPSASGTRRLTLFHNLGRFDTSRHSAFVSLTGTPLGPRTQTMHNGIDGKNHLDQCRSRIFYLQLLQPSLIWNTRNFASCRTSTKHPIETFDSSSSTSPATPPISKQEATLKINLLTTPLPELQTLLQSWSFPAFHAKQIHQWIFDHGVTSIDQMSNLPKRLREKLNEFSTLGSLTLAAEQVSTDGTIKRAYSLPDNQLIESVLMPYDDGRRTACISSQAGCAMGCVFCATGQMGFARQLTSEEILEQVVRFAVELKGRGERLSNIVFMGMGEPLANYRNLLNAIQRITTQLQISPRKITISTVGIVPNILKLAHQPLPLRLALSLHCANDEERSALLPANNRYGGLDTLMPAIKEYIEVKKMRVSFEWALIENQNDSPHFARQLGKLLQTYEIRPDMSHVNVIPLNPTGGYGGSPSGRRNVQLFVDVLEKEFGVSCTPRMRRGIDIDAGCGQLKASVNKKKLKVDSELRRELDGGTGGGIESHLMQEMSEDRKEFEMFAMSGSKGLPVVGVYEDEEDDNHGGADKMDEGSVPNTPSLSIPKQGSIVEFTIDEQAINLDEDEDFIDPEFENEFDLAEAERLISLVKGTSLTPKSHSSSQSPSSIPYPATDVVSNDASIKTLHTTTITSEESIKQAKKRRKKLLKNLKAIQKLKELQSLGKAMNNEQLEKMGREEEWKVELESVEHNLM